MEPTPQPAPDSFSPAGRAFNSAKKTAPIHPREIALIAVAGAHLCFLPWALGTMHLTSQLISLGLAVLALGVALLPRTQTEEFSRDGRPSRYTPLRGMLRFPAFWLGGLTLAYALIQALNPAWTYKTDGAAWWMEPIPHCAWLPSGATTPFADWNSWRSLIVWTSAWLLVCALWIGLTRRASIRALLVILATNGAVLALVGILQQAAGNGKILWFIPPATHYAVATILYKNHAGAFFNLILAVALALALEYHARATRRLQRSSPAPLFAACTVALGLIVVLSFSRAATLLMTAFLAFCALLGAAGWLRRPQRPSLRIILLATLALTAVVTVGTRYLPLERTTLHLEALFTTNRFVSIDQRLIAAQATGEMAADRLATGWGAGCFKFLFPLYQQHHPEIYIPSWDVSLMFLWEHAHNDYLEFLAELGFLGCAPITILAALWLAKLIRARAWKNTPLALVVLGLFVLLAHCWVDFNLQCPAILLTVAALATLTARWADLEPRHHPRRPR